MSGIVYFDLFVDCEATQPAVNDAALGRRAVAGIAAVLEARGLRGTFHVIPGDIEADGGLYRQLHQAGHEIGLHIHGAADGYEEFLGIYGPEMQWEIVSQGRDRFAKVMGFAPTTFCSGYGSANDFTYGVLYELGFRSGVTGIPTRVLPECASVSAGAPLDVHYAHRYNRVLPGYVGSADSGLDFVELPPTVDPESRLWGGKHPQDLRIELVDAKNHWYTSKKALDRQIAANVPVKMIRALTHNTFEYGNAGDFRRQTLERVIDQTFEIAAMAGCQCVGGTAQQIAAAYRAAVPPGSISRKLTLDRRGYRVAPPAGAAAAQQTGDRT